MINRVVLVGRITKDPEVRRSQSGMAVVRFTLAVNRRVSRDANNEQTADFISCVAFGKTAEFMEQYIKKGYQLGVEGRIQTGSYDNQQGIKVYTTDVACDSVQNLTPRNAPAESMGNHDYHDQYNNTASNEKNSPSDDYAPTLDISSDDLPF